MENQNQNKNEIGKRSKKRKVVLYSTILLVGVLVTSCTTNILIDEKVQEDKTLELLKKEFNSTEAKVEIVEKDIVKENIIEVPKEIVEKEIIEVPKDNITYINKEVEVVNEIVKENETILNPNINMNILKEEINLNEYKITISGDSNSKASEINLYINQKLHKLNLIDGVYTYNFTIKIDKNRVFDFIVEDGNTVVSEFLVINYK